MAEATARPLGRQDGTWTVRDRLVRRPFRLLARDSRLIVPVCIVLICGSLAAAAMLQMRLDRAHALAQAATFERARAAAIAAETGRALTRYARLGQVFAAAPQQYRSADLGRAEPAIRDIAVFDADGRLLTRLNPTEATPPAVPVFQGARTLFRGGLALRDNGRTIAVLFDTAGLAAAHVTLTPSPPPGSIQAPVPGWPLAAVTAVDEGAALRGWTGALPLYLFVILGPALAGGWLAALFVGAFQRHARAAAAIRALKSTRPIEARLMVRLANAERGAAEALRSKSEFIAHMSHELRTPLNAVIGFSDVIAGELYGPAGHPKYGEYARDIGHAGRALHARIGDILEFANIEAGRHPLRCEAVELAALAGSCVDEHQGRAFTRRITLSLGFGEPGQVRADPAALRRILSNLLANALAYTGDGGFVRADVRFEEGAGVLTLTDSGAGFSAAERGRAGKPFARFDRPHDEKGTVTGAGLGLAIAMELSRRMGGAMRLASLAGDGAVMEVRLPRI